MTDPLTADPEIPAPPPSSDEGGPASVRIDPVDDRDRRYPPDLPVVAGRVECTETIRLRDALGASRPTSVSTGGPTDTDTDTDTDPEAVKGGVRCRHYRALADASWRQRGRECTGFALAAIADYHLRSDLTPEEWSGVSDTERQTRTVSRRMLYEMAQVYDQADYVEGSTLRGALKGWNKTGVAADHLWPYAPGDEQGDQHGSLSMPRALDAAARPGATYLRIDVGDGDSMRDAIRRGFPLFVSARTHVGWFDLYLPGREVIERVASTPLSDVHAFVVYGFDDRGWLIHNSWGPEWGDGGFAVLPFDDFDTNAQDIWFVFPPRRIEFVAAHDRPEGSNVGMSHDSPRERRRVGDDDMWLHRLSIGDDGGLTRSGRYGMNADEVGTLLYLFRQRTRHWQRRRLAIFCDPGYWDPDDTLNALRPFRDEMMAQEIYPIFLVWDSAWLDGLVGWLHAEAGSDPNAPTAVVDTDDVGPDPELSDALSEMWSVLSKLLVAQSSAPRIWRQLHASSAAAFRPGTGAGWVLADRLAHNLTRASFDIHLVGYGAGDLLLSELAVSLAAPVSTCQLWSPITTMDRFSATYEVMLRSRRLAHLHVVTLASAQEQADRTGPVPGSLVQIASEVLEVGDIDLDTAVEERDDRLTWKPEPASVLGLHSTMAEDRRLAALIADGSAAETRIDSGTHVGMLTDRQVWRATIDSIRAFDVSGGSPDRPAPWDPPEPAPSLVDPLDWVISRTSG